MTGGKYGSRLQYLKLDTFSLFEKKTIKGIVRGLVVDCICYVEV